MRAPGEGGARRARGGGMEGPMRFQCPPEFEAVTPSSPLGGPKTELWLIRTPADFCPESLEGLSVPLEGEGRLRPPGDGDSDNDGARRLYVLRGGPGGAGTPFLLSPAAPSGPLGCAPPLRGCITITQSFQPPPTPGSPPGTPPGRKKRKRKVKEPPEVATPGGPEQGEGGPGPPPTVLGVPEEPGGARKKKKKKKKEQSE